MFPSLISSFSSGCKKKKKEKPSISNVGYVCRVHGDRKGSSGAATLFPESSIVIERPRSERAKRLSRRRLAWGYRFSERMNGRMGDCMCVCGVCIYACVYVCVRERERKQVKSRRSKRRTSARIWKKKKQNVLYFARRRFFVHASVGSRGPKEKVLLTSNKKSSCHKKSCLSFDFVRNSPRFWGNTWRRGTLR